MKVYMMMLLVALATAVSMKIFEDASSHGVPAAEITSLVVDGNVPSRDFSSAPAFRVRVKGTAKNCQDKIVRLEVRVMDMEGRRLRRTPRPDRAGGRDSTRFGEARRARQEGELTGPLIPGSGLLFS